MEDGNGATWETTDLGTAAYVHMRGQLDDSLGVKLLGSHVAEGGRGPSRFVFRFTDPHGHGRRLQVEYLNSDCRAFDAAVRSLKKLCYDTGSKKDRRRTWST